MEDLHLKNILKQVIEDLTCQVVLDHESVWRLRMISSRPHSFSEKLLCSQGDS